MGKKRKLSNTTKGGLAKRKQRPITLPAATWDLGASGPAARARPQVIEDAADIDPETGEVRNVNGIKRARIVDMLEVWLKQEVITTAGYNFAVALRDAFEATQRAPGWPDNDRVQSSPKPDHAVTIQVDRHSRYHAVARFIHPADFPVIDYLVLRNKEHRAELGYFRHKASLAALGPALDRCAAAMDSPRHRLMRKIGG